MKNINIKTTESSRYELIDSTQINNQELRFGYKESYSSKIKNIIKWMNAICKAYGGNSICFRVTDEDLLFDEVIVQITKSFRVRYKSKYPLEYSLIKEIVNQIENSILFPSAMDVYNTSISVENLDDMEAMSHSNYINSLPGTGKIIELSVSMNGLSELSRLIIGKNENILNVYGLDKGFLMRRIKLKGRYVHPILNIGDYYGLYNIYKYDNRIHVQLYDKPVITDDIKDMIGLRSDFVFKSIQNDTGFKIRVVDEVLKLSDKLMSDSIIYN